MNNVYFACQTCKSYIDAGYRWCYWALEHPGLVLRGEQITVERVLAANNYWNGTEDEEGLPVNIKDVIKAFLIRHQAHNIIYGESENFMSVDHYTFLYWINEDEKDTLDLTPRTFIERLQLATWEEVTVYIEKLTIRPWWWDVTDIRQYAQQAFSALLEQHNQYRQ